MGEIKYNDILNKTAEGVYDIYENNRYEEIINNCVEDYFKNITKIVVIKKEYGTEKRLEGIKFNLLDKDKNVVYENLSTDENGEIHLSNMIPGKYYLKETQNAPEHGTQPE